MRILFYNSYKDFTEKLTKKQSKASFYTGRAYFNKPCLTFSRLVIFGSFLSRIWNFVCNSEFLSLFLLLWTIKYIVLRACLTASDIYGLFVLTRTRNSQLLTKTWLICSAHLSPLATFPPLKERCVTIPLRKSNASADVQTIVRIVTSQRKSVSEAYLIWREIVLSCLHTVFVVPAGRSWSIMPYPNHQNSNLKSDPIFS